ncbi:MAG: hypothetical protein IID44_18200 [Planctomycetes bacterium]|nr:hypothetical protein [Planctomycetota bacterium]
MASTRKKREVAYLLAGALIAASGVAATARIRIGPLPATRRQLARAMYRLDAGAEVVGEEVKRRDHWSRLYKS